MAAKIRKRIATFCRALAARLDPPGVVARCEPYIYAMSTAPSTAAVQHVTITHGGPRS